jgi:pilus assembly protein FimV
MTSLNLDSVMRQIGLAVIILCAGSAHAVGIGTIQVQSGLGQSLKLSVALIGADSANLLASCIKLRIASLDGTLIAAPSVSIVRSAQGQSSLQILTSQAVYEPAMSVSVDLTCDARVHRDFQILLDPVTNLADTLLRLPRGNSDGAVTNKSGIQDGNRLVIPGMDPSQRSAMGLTGTVRAPRNLPPLVPASRSGSTRNILKLSSQDTPETKRAVFGQLKLSRQLAEPTSSGNGLPTEEFSVAQRRYAMLLRGEDPLGLAERENLLQKQQIVRLQRQFEASKIQQTADQAALEALQQNSLSLGWVAGLVALLLASLGVVGWLVARLRRSAEERPEDAWDLSVLRAERRDESDAVDTTANTEQAGNTTSSLSVLGKKATPVGSALPAFLHNKNLDGGEQVASAAPTISETADLAAKAAMVSQEALQFYPARVEHLKVEEISDVMQEAEFWLSLNDPARAIEILEPYSKLDSPESPMPWLFLLDLYRESDSQANYDELREKTMRIFNTNIPEWFEIPGNAQAMSLEDFPHVIERICALWETDLIVDYLKSLMLDNRDGIRSGFDIEVYQEVMLLMAIAKEFNPAQTITETGDVSRLMLK